MRQTWDEYFLTLAKHASTRATCNRLHAGCVITIDKRIIATGYNGSLPGADHCDDVGHLMVDGHCVATIHAETNAIANAARAGTSTMGGTAYVTHTPCWNCVKNLVAAGVKRIVYAEAYPNAASTHPPAIGKLLTQASVILELYSPNNEAKG